MTARINYNLSCGNLLMGNITSNTLNATMITTSNLFVTGTTVSLNVTTLNRMNTNLTSSTLNVSNITVGTLRNTNISSATLIASSGITVGNLNFTGTITQNGGPVVSSSQWTTTNNNAIFYTGGNVGINNTSPTTALDVSGGARITGVVSVGTLVTNNITSASFNTVNMTTSNILSSNAYMGNSSGNATLNINELSSELIDFYSSTTSVGNISCLSNSQGIILNGGNMTNQFMLSSSGNVGINTTNPNYMLTMVGTSGNIDGPHRNVYVNTDLTYPIFQQLNWARDTIALSFDSYYDGTNWRASSTNPAFQIYKLGNNLRFNYGNGSAGSNLGNFFLNSAFIVGSTGSIGVNTAAPEQKLHVSSGPLLISSSNGVNMNISPMNGAFGTIECYNTNNTAKLTLCLNSYGGPVAIRKTSATWPLDVTGFYNPGFATYNYINYANYDYFAGTGTVYGLGNTIRDPSITVWVEHRIACSYVILASDERIKTNIVNIEKTSALNTIRQLQPRKYNYVDKVAHGNKTEYGFVAQEVVNVLKDAVSKTSNYIPDIYDVADVITDSLKTTIQLCNKELVNTVTTDHKIRLYVYDEFGKEKKIDTEIEEIIDNKTFIVKEDISMYDQIFVYGCEVSDFLSVDKDVVYTVTTAALQEVDEQLQETKSKVSQLNSCFIYRGTVQLQNGIAHVNIDTDSVYKNKNGMIYNSYVKYLHNNDSFDKVKGTINGNILTITCQNTNSIDNVDWIVMAEC